MALFRSDSILPSMVMCMQIEAHFQGCTTVPEQWPVTSSRWLTISCKLLSSWIPWKPGVRQVPEGSWEWANGENWLQNHLWCPSDPLGEGIDDDDDDDGFLGKKILPTGKVAFTMSFIYLCFFWVCVCVHACVYVCVCVCVCAHACVSMCECVYVCAHASFHRYVSTYLRRTTSSSVSYLSRPDVCVFPWWPKGGHQDDQGVLSADATG